MTLEAPGEPTALAFNTATPTELPARLVDAVVEQLAAGEYRIESDAREWRIQASAVHLHRDVGTPFYQAIPPRAAPWTKRIFWRLVLSLAGSRAGLATLRWLRH
jgi:hypothetical protein